MLIGIIGENCSGKSTLASRIKDTIGAEIVTGKDYLRMAKSEAEARQLFQRKLTAAVNGSNVVYVISEPEQLVLLPDGAVRILVSADLATIKERFKTRMRGILPVPVERMLETRHGLFDNETFDLWFSGVSGDAAALCEQLMKLRENHRSCQKG